jgi:hypothetical protein
MFIFLSDDDKVIAVSETHPKENYIDGGRWVVYVPASVSLLDENEKLKLEMEKVEIEIKSILDYSGLTELIQDK